MKNIEYNYQITIVLLKLLDLLGSISSKKYPRTARSPHAK